MFAVRNSQQYGIGKIRTHEVFACEIRMRTQCGTAFTPESNIHQSQGDFAQQTRFLQENADEAAEVI